MAKIVKKATDIVTKKSSWKGIKTGAIAGSLQGLGVFLLGKTMGTIASAMAVGSWTTKGKLGMSESAKQIAIVNQVSDATSNLLIGEN